jgi:nicotinamidase-related amidase
MPVWYNEWLSSRETLPVDLDEEATALIVIDLQKQLTDAHGSWASAGVDTARIQTIIPAVTDVIASARSVGIPIVFTRSTPLPVAGPVAVGRLVEAVEAARAALTRDELAEQLELVAELTPGPDDLVITKSGMSAFYGTPLAAYLKRLGIRRVVLVGATTSGAVEATARDAFHSDLRVVVCSDATADWDQSLHDHALYATDWAAGQVLTGSQIAAAWAKSPVSI